MAIRINQLQYIYELSKDSGINREAGYSKFNIINKKNNGVFVPANKIIELMSERAKERTREKIKELKLKDLGEKEFNKAFNDWFFSRNGVCYTIDYNPDIVVIR